MGGMWDDRNEGGKGEWIAGQKGSFAQLPG